MLRNMYKSKYGTMFNKNRDMQTEIAFYQL